MWKLALTHTPDAIRLGVISGGCNISRRYLHTSQLLLLGPYTSNIVRQSGCTKAAEDSNRLYDVCKYVLYNLFMAIFCKYDVSIYRLFAILRYQIDVNINKCVKFKR